MSSSSKFTPNYKPQFGKPPMHQDTAERIKGQIAENLQRRLRDRIAELEGQLAEQHKGRLADEIRRDQEQTNLVNVIDTLLDFISQNLNDIPQELAELIAERMEQRMIKTAGTSSKVLDDIAGGAKDGMVLRRTATWTKP